MISSLRMHLLATLNEMIVSILFSVCCQGARSTETENVVEDLSDMKQPSLVLGRKLGAVAPMT